jgi:hypothetical protein
MLVMLIGQSAGNRQRYNQAGEPNSDIVVVRVRGNNVAGLNGVPVDLLCTPIRSSDAVAAA